MFAHSRPVVFAYFMPQRIWDLCMALVVALGIAIAWPISMSLAFIFTAFRG